MINAKVEFLEEISDVKEKLVCAEIQWSRYGHSTIEILLKVGFSNKDYTDFLSKLDFSYYNGFGGQELFGTIWFENSYMDRVEYDGSERWALRSRPEIPEKLIV